MKDHAKGDYRPYINPLVKSANSFKPEIDSEDVVINGVSIRMYAHLVAFFIKKEANCVKITHIASVRNIKILVKLFYFTIIKHIYFLYKCHIYNMPIHSQ